MGGSRLFQIGYSGGRGWGAKPFFIKKFRGVCSLIAKYILRGVHW